MRFAKLALACFACLALYASTAHAQIATFDLSYSGAPNGNSAVGTGTVTLDESLINNPGINFQRGSNFITALTLTISGATSGNGTFTLSDFDGSASSVSGGGYRLSLEPGPVDFSQELVGQSNFGDFNLFGNNGSGAPRGISPKTIATAEGGGNPLALTSFRPAAVPEPGSLALLTGLSLAGAAFLRRRKQARNAA